MGCSLNSLKGVIKGIICGNIVELFKGDTRSLDYSSYGGYPPGRYQQPRKRGRSPARSARQPCEQAPQEHGRCQRQRGGTQSGVDPGPGL